MHSGDFVRLLEPFHTGQCLPAKKEILGTAVRNKLRLIIADDLSVSWEAGAKRDKRVDELKAQADLWVGRHRREKRQQLLRQRALGTRCLSRWLA